MRLKKIAFSDIAEKLELPAEAVGALLVTVSGRGRILIENCLGVVHFSADAVCVRAKEGRLTVYGKGLKISALGRGKMLLRGDVGSMEWE